ncbi:type I toxin-antitoxin system Fst family toxin [Staphylococcus argensis]|nr:type I toxin-antitoxin system Fst family toxin [Staphylococcus argensis]MCY6992097.1 type I toxin-antitoxin system Fst family toxin [Staphylococcus argensis]
MIEQLIQFTTTILSGCIIALFTQWLRERNDKNGRQ